jgi:hypothetical protein
VSEPKRRHRATGKRPPGGSRPGAGRPQGSSNTLEYGEVRALKAVRLRVPTGATPELEHLAGRALERIVDVMEERVSSFQARAVLSAATRIREEACGPLAQKLEHSGPEGGALVVEVRSFAEEEESDAAQEAG